VVAVVVLVLALELVLDDVGDYRTCGAAHELAQLAAADSAAQVGTAGCPQA